MFALVGCLSTRIRFVSAAASQSATAAFTAVRASAELVDARASSNEVAPSASKVWKAIVATPVSTLLLLAFTYLFQASAPSRSSSSPSLVSAPFSSTAWRPAWKWSVTSSERAAVSLGFTASLASAASMSSSNALEASPFPPPPLPSRSPIPPMPPLPTPKKTKLIAKMAARVPKVI